MKPTLIDSFESHRIDSVFGLCSVLVLDRDKEVLALKHH